MRRFAPIVLFAYKRPGHLQRTLEALRRNAEAADSELIVYADGAKGDADAEGVRKTRLLLREVPGFRHVRVAASPVNRGLAASVIAGVSETLRECDRVIVLEDDMVCAPYFLRFMNEALERLAEDRRIDSIHGYLSRLEVPLPDCFLRRGADCWGWATWRDRWQWFNPDATALLAELRRRHLTREFDLGGCYPYTRMLQAQAAGKIDSWAIRWHASTFLAGKFYLQAGRPLVRNIGVDASGEHCGLECFYDTELWRQPLALDENPPLETAEIAAAYRRFYRRNLPTFWQRVRHKLMRCIAGKR
ncbi:glycosyltransferase [Victivallis sp. Marseille-Q1083]|uniref:glycosyltransferase n=1 Tax=Victivallis sp. Marseille-Q1083 TaxID=2717288 RepID=UPI0015894039|nr:glycosyltransferase [Victivallis sp. Marseille-Q1083]